MVYLVVTHLYMSSAITEIFGMLGCVFVTLCLQLAEAELKVHMEVPTSSRIWPKSVYFSILQFSPVHFI